ncbi:RING/U-box superfamily protein [Raphanus sativus]|nr:RING/U-box superfamily protein [Raphanus sativus]
MITVLGGVRLYKFDVPSESDVRIIVVSIQGGHLTQRFQLSQYTGRGQRRRGSKAGLSKKFVDMVRILTPYLQPPACPVLVFHFQTRVFGQDHVPETDITRTLLYALRTRHSILADEDAITRCVPIASPATKILDCYQSSELCFLCEKGYTRDDEIVHKTRCNHIFHGACISSYLLRTPHCPVCSAHLPPVDMRTLLFS